MAQKDSVYSVRLNPKDKALLELLAKRLDRGIGETFRDGLEALALRSGRYTEVQITCDGPLKAMFYGGGHPPIETKGALTLDMLRADR